MSESIAEEALHVYDGIEEYDNPLPGWWTYLFWATIVFSGFYVVLSFTQPGLVNTRVAYQNAVTAQLEKQFATLGQLQPDAPTILGFLEDPEQAKWLAVGESIFRTNCVSCHGSDGGGVSAPNMTDDHFLHVEGLADIVQVVHDGARNGAMPAWGNRLQSNEIVLVSAYVASLRGAGVAGRAPEGEVIAPWSE